MQDIYRVIARLMQTDLTVMITGESGTGKELVARALHDYGKRQQRPVRRHQHGGDPARADRERAVRPREGRLHRRHRRAQSAASSRPRAARCSSTRSATCRWRRRPGCCACCSRASTRPSAAARRSRPTCASSPPPTSDLRNADPAGAVPRGPVLPAQRRAAAPAAAARAHRGHPRPRAPLPAARRDGRACRRRSLEPAALERLKPLSLAGQRARAGEPDPPPRRALSAGRHRRGADRAELAASAPSLGPAAPAAGDHAPNREAAAAQEQFVAGIERHIADLFRSFGDGLPPAGLYHRVLRELERAADRRDAGGDPRQPDQGGRDPRPQPQHAAQEDPRPRFTGRPRI